MSTNPFAPDNKGGAQLLHNVVHELMHAAFMAGCTIAFVGGGPPIGDPDTNPNANENIERYLKHVIDDPIVEK